MGKLIFYQPSTLRRPRSWWSMLPPTQPSEYCRRSVQRT